MDDSVYTYGVGARNCDEQEETSSLVVRSFCFWIILLLGWMLKVVVFN